MAVKLKTLIVSQVNNPDHDLHSARTHGDAYKVPRWNYLVKEVKNSTTPRVSDTLTKAQVDEFCEDKNWSVTIR